MRMRTHSGSLDAAAVPLFELSSWLSWPRHLGRPLTG